MQDVSEFQDLSFRFKIYMDLQFKYHFHKMMLGCNLKKHTDNKVYNLSHVHELKMLSTKTIETIPMVKTVQALRYFSIILTVWKL